MKRQHGEEREQMATSRIPCGVPWWRPIVAKLMLSAVDRSPTFAPDSPTREPGCRRVKMGFLFEAARRVFGARSFDTKASCPAKPRCNEQARCFSQDLIAVRFVLTTMSSPIKVRGQSVGRDLVVHEAVVLLGHRDERRFESLAF